MADATLVTDGQANPGPGPTATTGSDGKPPEGATPPASTDGKPADGDQPKGDAKAADAPKGEFTDFKAPDGVTLDTDVLTEFKGVAKELGLDQANAQKLVDIGAKLAQKNTDAFVAKIAEEQTKWLNSSKADKEFGGDKLAENLGVAKKAMESFATPELRAMLDESKLGNHPEVIRLFYRVGLAISQDKLVKGAPPGTQPDPAKVLYPSHN